MAIFLSFHHLRSPSGRVNLPGIAIIDPLPAKLFF
jgi:hypothetical protein